MKKIYSTLSYLLTVLCFVAFTQVGMSQTSVSVIYSGGSFNGENSWQLVDATANSVVLCDDAPSVPGTYTATVTDGNLFQLWAWETFGDNWNGASIELVNNTYGFTIHGPDDNPGGADGNGSPANCTDVGTNGALAWEGIIDAIQCEITCPDDVVSSTQPGTCEPAFVEIPLPFVNDDCLGLPACFEEVGSGQVNLLFGNTLINTPFTISNAPLNAVANVTITGVWNSDNSFQTEIPPLTLEGTLIGTLPFGGPDCQENEINMTIPMAVYNAAAADGNLDFVVGADTDVNTFCASDYINIDLAVPQCTVDAINDYNGTGDASDVYPLGETVVTFTTQDNQGNPVQCSFTVTVQDLEPPVLDCPGDETINLDAGECYAVYSFEVIATDNCGLAAIPVGDPIPVPGFFGGLESCPGSGSSLICSGGGTSQIQEMDVSGLPQGAFVTDGCFIWDNTSWGASLGTINFYAAPVGTTPPPCYKFDTPIGTSGPFNLQGMGLTPGAAVCIPMLQSFSIPAGMGLFMEVYTPPVGGIVFNGTSCNGITATGQNTYLCSDLCGDGYFANFGFNNIDAFMAFKAQDVTYVTPGGTPGSNEFASGDALPIGTHCWEFEAEDLDGNIGSCEWCVTVEEFPEDLQSTTLACNDHINVSVDQTCTAVLTPDMGLEGGPYGCYETYTVTVAGLPNSAVSGNGTNAVTIDAYSIPAFVANGMAGPFEYSVTDPDNDNNTCWGTFMLEDKIAPTITCDTITVSCVTGTDIGESEFGAGNGAWTTDGTTGWPDNVTGGDLAVASVTTSGAPAGNVLESIEVSVQIDHSWVADLTLTLEGPDGTVVTLLDGFCAVQDNVDAQFSTDATNGPACAGSFTPGPHEDCPGDWAVSAAVSGTSAAQGDLADLLAGGANGTWTLRVSDDIGADGGCLSGFSVTTNWAKYAASAPDYADNCGTLPLEYTDVVVEGDCTSEFAQTIYRTWSVDDAKGNGPATCTQVINVTRENLSSLVVPTNWDGLPGNNDIISCSANFPTTDEGYPHPSMTGYPGGVGSCGTISWTYTDIELPICVTSSSCITCDEVNSYKVLRNWIIVDWCTGEVLEHAQIVKVMDLDAPTLAGVEDVTISTDIWGCAATLDLSELGISASDNCSPSVYIHYASTGGTVVYNPFNACEAVEVVFDSPANCQGPVVVSVTAEDCCGNYVTEEFNVTIIDQVPPVVVADEHTVVSLSADGTAKIYAQTFDDGSHDGCGPIGMSVKRMSTNCPAQDYFPPAGDDNTQYNEIVHFCCEDIGEDVMVQFRVCDDADCNGVTGTGGDNCNIAMVVVTVQDKLAPVVVAPEDLTIDCIDYFALGNVGDLSDEELNTLFGSAESYSTCGGSPNQITQDNFYCDEALLPVMGVISRVFTVTTAGGTSTDIQKITIVENPNGSSFLQCNDVTFPAGSPEANKGYDWCQSASNNGPISDFGAVVVNSSDCGGFTPTAPEIDIDNLCTEVGINVSIDTFAFAGGGCFKYLVHWEVIDQCKFDENFVDPVTGESNPFHNLNGYYHIYVEYDVFDTEGPVVECGDDIVLGCNETTYNGAIVGSATDNCTDAAYFGWDWKLDLGNDFTIDYEGSGSSVTYPLGFELGTHRIIWIVSDGCGNVTTEDCVFEVSTDDNKAPTPYCYDGLSTAIMQPDACMVELWATDFDAGSYDDCGGVTMTMVPEIDVEGMDADDAYNASTDAWTFDCSYIENGVTAVIEVRIYATDGSGNYDYCVASLRLDDNFDCCEDQGGSKEIGGAIATEAGDAVEGVTVEASSNHSEYPQYQVSDNDGAYAFYNAPQYYDFDLTSTLDENYLNGVTTLDLVLIQKHILSIQTLDSPYKLIAADINSDCNVTANDLLELRKLILGLYAGDDLPNNESWRFVDAAYQFQNPTQPCPFDEVIDIDNLTNSEMNENFSAVKIGDVNGTAVANATMDAENRNANAITLTVNEAVVEAGEEFAVEFTSADFNEVSGYQFTLGFNNAEFVGVNAGALKVSEANFGLNRIDEGMITTSWGEVNAVSANADEVLFTVTFKAVSNGTVSEMITLNSRITPAEAYQGATLDVYEVNLEFRTDNGVVEDAAFELYQNEPNPFNGNTIVGFSLPASANATLTVFDVTGKVVYIERGEFAKGMNTVTLNSNAFNTSGVLYYQLESGEYTATKKMIILE